MPASIAGRRKANKAGRLKKNDSASHSSVSATKGPTKAAAQPSARDRSDDANNMPAKPQALLTPPQNSTAQLNPKPNVFEFLQEGDSSSSAPSDNDSEDEQEEDEEAAKEGRPKTYIPVDASRLVRDGGLPSPESSFRASSPEQTFSVASRDSIATDLEPTTPPEGSPATAYLRLAHKRITHSRDRRVDVHQRHVQRRRISPDDRQSDYSAPEDYYISPNVHHSLHKKSSPPLAPEVPGSLVRTDKRRDLEKSSKRDESSLVSGYASLTSKLDSSGKEGNKLVPLYRRFENVNHRILLYLQDEIAQMEEELQLMDEYDAKQRAVTEGEAPPEPASRRMDVEARHYSAFYARRTELLERLTYKVNQYNDALCSYSKMRHSLPKATLRDVHAYRTWIREHAHIAKNETTFLDHERDLVSVNSAAQILGGDNISILYFIIGVMSAALLLPLLAY